MTARYQPGTHPAYVAGRVVVITEADRLAELAALGESEVTVLGVVQALSRGALTDLPGFAIVQVEGDDLRVVLRGGYDVTVDGRTWSGGGVATWTEHLATGAASHEVRVSTPGGGEATLPISSGVVLVDSLTWTAASAGEDAPLVPAPAVVPTPIPTPPAPEPEPEPELRPVSAPPVDDAHLTRGEPDEDFDAMAGATVVGRRQEEPAAAVPDAPATPALGDHDGHTVAASAIRRIMQQAPSAPQTTPQATPQAAPKATLVLSTGRSIDVDGPVLIGRAPRVAQTSGLTMPTLVVVEDPYVSGTHLEVAFQGGSLVATDRSTNGTLLTRPDRAPERLVKDVPTVLTSGSVLALSDDLTATVTLEAP